MRFSFINAKKSRGDCSWLHAKSHHATITDYASSMWSFISPRNTWKMPKWIKTTTSTRIIHTSQRQSRSLFFFFWCAKLELVQKQPKKKHLRAPHGAAQMTTAPGIDSVCVESIFKSLLSESASTEHQSRRSILRTIDYLFSIIESDRVFFVHAFGAQVRPNLETKPGVWSNVVWWRMLIKAVLCGEPCYAA